MPSLPEILSRDTRTVYTPDECGVVCAALASGELAINTPDGIRVLDALIRTLPRDPRITIGRLDGGPIGDVLLHRMFSGCLLLPAPSICNFLDESLTSVRISMAVRHGVTIDTVREMPFRHLVISRMIACRPRVNTTTSMSDSLNDGMAPVRDIIGRLGINSAPLSTRFACAYFTLVLYRNIERGLADEAAQMVNGIAGITPMNARTLFEGALSRGRNTEDDRLPSFRIVRPRQLHRVLAEESDVGVQHLAPAAHITRAKHLLSMVGAPGSVDVSIHIPFIPTAIIAVPDCAPSFSGVEGWVDPVSADALAMMTSLYSPVTTEVHLTNALPDMMGVRLMMLDIASMGAAASVAATKLASSFISPILRYRYSYAMGTSDAPATRFHIIHHGRDMIYVCMLNYAACLFAHYAMVVRNLVIPASEVDIPYFVGAIKHSLTILRALADACCTHAVGSRVTGSSAIQTFSDLRAGFDYALVHTLACIEDTCGRQCAFDPCSFLVDSEPLEYTPVRRRLPVVFWSLDHPMVREILAQVCCDGASPSPHDVPLFLFRCAITNVMNGIVLAYHSIATDGHRVVNLAKIQRHIHVLWCTAFSKRAHRALMNAPPYTVEVGDRDINGAFSPYTSLVDTMSGLTLQRNFTTTLTFVEYGIRFSDFSL